MESRFSPHAWQQYVLSPRHPPLVFEVHANDDKGELFEIDVRRCRRNALAKSAYPWPIFLPFDSPGGLCVYMSPLMGPKRLMYIYVRQYV